RRFACGFETLPFASSAKRLPDECRRGRQDPFNPAFESRRSLVRMQNYGTLRRDLMKRIASFVYGIVCYAAFFPTFLYAIGFLGNFGLPKSIDSGPEGSIAVALAIDGALLALFALQHSIMARPWFKRMWTRFVPDPVERSTYVLFSSLALLFMF